MAFVLLLVLFNLVRSKLGQAAALRLNWDLNGDGVVDWRDLLVAAKNTPLYKHVQQWQDSGQSGCMQRVRAFVPLGDIEDLQAAAAIPPRSAEELGAKLVQMEAKMDALMQKMRIVSSSMAALH